MPGLIIITTIILIITMIIVIIIIIINSVVGYESVNKLTSLILWPVHTTVFSVSRLRSSNSYLKSSDFKLFDRHYRWSTLAHALGLLAQSVFGNTAAFFTSNCLVVTHPHIPCRNWPIPVHAAVFSLSSQLPTYSCST